MKKPLVGNLLLLVVLFVITLALYQPALSGGPLVDDFRLLLAAKYGGWLSNFPATAPGVAGVFWRPIVSIFIHAEWLLFHLNFIGYRIVSALLVATTALAVYGVITKITKDKTTGIVALLFIVWPSHHETMIWIAGKTDGLPVCLAWLSLWSFVDWWLDEKLPHWKISIWLPLLILALLAKESVIVMPAIFFVAALFINPRRFNERKQELFALAVVATLLTVGYLWLRAQMIHTPMLGGGYRGGAKRGLLQGAYEGLNSYHLNFNLLTTYVPGSNHIADKLGWSPDAFVSLLTLFGVGGILRQLSRRSASSSFWILLALLFFAITATDEIAGNYPFALAFSVMQIPAGAAAIVILLSLLGYFAFRYRKSLAKSCIRATTWMNEKPVAFWIVTGIALVVETFEIRSGIVHAMPFLFIFSYWLVCYLTRPVRTASIYPSLALLMIALSVVSMLPVLMIRQVDTNLVNARFDYLATTFGVAPFVFVIWTAVKSERDRTLAAIGISIVAFLTIRPIIMVWAHSVRISQSFVDTVQKTTKRKVYVLASPAITPSANSVLLGGEMLDAAGGLLRNYQVTVMPGYYADGFTEGDHLQIDSVEPDTWKITVSSAHNTGILRLLPSYPNQQVSPAYKTIPGSIGYRERTVQVTDPDGEVIAVTERGVIRLR